LILAVDDFLQTRDDVRVAVFAQFYHDPAAVHFVGDCAGGAGTCEGIEDEVVGGGGDFHNSLKQCLRFWRSEGSLIWEKRLHLGFRGAVATYV